MRGLSRSTCLETKARLTSVRSLVCTGGSSSSMEFASTPSKFAEMRALGAIARLSAEARRLLPSEPAVAQRAVDVVEAAEAPEPVLLPEECAALAVQAGIGLVRVLEEVFLMRIEPQAPCTADRRKGRAVAASWRSCWITSAPCQRDARPYGR